MLIPSTRSFFIHRSHLASLSLSRLLSSGESAVYRRYIYGSHMRGGGRYHETIFVHYCQFQLRSSSYWRSSQVAGGAYKGTAAWSQEGLLTQAAARSGSNSTYRLYSKIVIVMISAEPGRKAPYSCDIRWRVVWQRVGMELPFKTIAKNLNIAASTAYLHYKRFQNTGEVRAASHRQRESTRKLNS